MPLLTVDTNAMAQLYPDRARWRPPVEHDWPTSLAKSRADEVLRHRRSGDDENCGRTVTAQFPPLREGDLAGDPLGQFQSWFDAARAELALAEAAALATADITAQPAVRMVLVKSWDRRGFVFYSNRESRKGAELLANPRAALLFHWPSQGRQVRLEGEVEQVTDEESDAYFESRPRMSQIGAVASAQSRPIAGRPELDRRVTELETKLRGRAIARPPWWGGYRLQPASYEFWQHQEDRLHDRILYSRQHSGWRVDRLQP
ncbi:MAG: pyridoxamine 5'-phosphate oxidase [Candidatus Dormiibacterota bacterium]